MDSRQFQTREAIQRFHLFHNSLLRVGSNLVHRPPAGEEPEKGGGGQILKGKMGREEEGEKGEKGGKSRNIGKNASPSIPCQ
jgi:hypothetical protein